METRLKGARICAKADVVALRGVPSSPKAGLLSMKRRGERKSLRSLLRKEYTKTL